MVAETLGLESSSIWVLALLGTFTVTVLGLVHKLGLIYQFWHQVDPKSTRHGGEIVAEVLKAHGVRYLFTLVGGHISPILVASEKLGIRVVDTRHEVTAVFAADAVARLSGIALYYFFLWEEYTDPMTLCLNFYVAGTVGVAAVTAGPGVTNTVTAMKNAQMAESPVLLIGGAAGTLQKGRGALQDIDQLSLFKPLCKFCASVNTVKDIAPVLRKAIAVAQCNTPGPVFVEFPLDILYPYHLVEREILRNAFPKSLKGKALNWFLHNYLRNLFAGAWEVQDFSPLPVNMPEATEAQVQQCVELISRARKPLLLLGSQVTLPPIPANKLREALEELGIPCFLGGMARGMLGKNSPIHIRQNRREALKEADLVILAGTVCDFRLSYGRILSKHSKIIAVNRNREQLFKNADFHWTPNIAIKGDAALFFVCLNQKLKGYSCPQDWVMSLKKADQRKEKINREKAEEPTEQHLNPLKLLHHIDYLLPEDSLLVADGGDFVASAAYIIKPRGPLSWLDPGAFGTLGVGGGFALGAKLCRPESEVWILYGDGSLGFSIMEFDTFVRHRIPVIALVGNDACWTQISREQMPLLGSNVACALDYLDYHVVVEGLGGKGLLLTRKNEDQMDDIIRTAQSKCRNGQPILLNALIGKTTFREGSIAM
ncbi:2-hydroxyacyl-CoA lyase 2 isoform X1 [Pituophis catenifer annectens]|uniref:2-hydroxyacyl-CoA lyase 2 isoform X1 n=1 Tax=Pituophis catenifer annectens TaxID=94852 RepID=UPI003996987B